MLLVLLVACGSDSTGPGPGPGPGPVNPGDADAVRIAVNDTVNGAITAEVSSIAFALRSESSGRVAVFYQSLSGELLLTLADSVSGDTLAESSFPQDADLAHLVLRRLPSIDAAAGQILLLRARTLSGRGTGSIRLVVRPVNPAPEHVPAVLLIGDTLTGELLEDLADVDEFTFDATAGDEIVGFVQSMGQAVPAGLLMEVHTPGRVARLAIARNSAGDSELDAQATGRFVVPADGAYIVTLGHTVFDATAAKPGSGPYRLLFRRVSRAPEATSAILPVGDTLSAEAIDFVGDIDEFQVPVAAGETYNVFLRTAVAAPFQDAILRVSVLPQAGIAGVTRVSTGRDSALAGQPTGSFTVPAAGNLVLRVEGEGPGLNRGGYQLFVYRVNRAPELVPALLAAGGSVVETIEFPGDIDEFDVVPGPTGVTNVVLGRIARGGVLDMALTSTLVRRCFAPEGPAEPMCGSGRLFELGPIHVIIETPAGFDSPRGPYRLSALPIDTTPEGPSGTITFGTTETDHSEPAGDLDVFHFTYVAGDLLELDVLPAAVGPELGMNIELRGANEALPLGFGGIPLHTGRFSLPLAGDYRIKIGNSGVEPVQTGQYTMRLARYPSAAEGPNASISTGDSLTGETIGELGDVDDFTYSAAPGTEVQAFVRGSSRLRVDAVASNSNTVIREGQFSTTGRVLVPPGGQLRFRVLEPRSTSISMSGSSVFAFVGPYQIVLRAINRAPETAPAVVSTGVPVASERIEPAGDIDEFLFAGTAGQAIRASISAPEGFDGRDLLLEIVDPLNGAVLASRFTSGPMVSTSTVMLPGTRSYLIRVAGRLDTEGFGRFVVLIE